MGLNQWREEDDWPLARALNTKYFLHSTGNAASLRGGGGLSPVLSGSEHPDTYVYDPSNPVPTRGGPLCCDRQHLVAGPRDQRSVEARDDVLVYTTPAFTENVEMTGQVSLELFAASSAVDTDFVAKLVDVGPEGFARNLTEGILRARYRNSQEKPELMEPGKIYKLTLDLWSTSNVFIKGHALRLEISSSNFPRFDRNLNTGELQSSGKSYSLATNTIYHDSQHPSALILPILQSH
jgi:putative CocE/NonD family hydrolase